MNLGFPAVPTAQCSRLREEWEIACQREKVVNGNCKWGSNTEVMCAGLPAERGPRLELLTRSAVLRYARKQKGKSTRMNDTATSPLLYALSFSRSLIHYAAAIVDGEAGRNATRGKNSNNNRSRANGITAEIVQWHTNKKSSGWMREELRLNATLGFFTNACVDSMLELSGSLMVLLQVLHFTHIWTSKDNQKQQQNACHTKNQLLLYILLVSYWDIFIFPGTA